MEKIRKKRLFVFGLITLSIVTLVGGITYSFFVSGGITKEEVFSMTSGTMSLTFSDGNPGINQSITLGDSVTKKFILENTGTLPASVSIQWKNLVNTYLNESLSYKLMYSDTIDGTYEELIPETNMPTTSTPITQDLVSEVSVPVDTTYYYDLIITFNNLSDIDQTPDLNASFNTEFDINNAKRNVYYTLSIDPNGGVWKEYTSAQEYQLLNNDTMEIENPTKIGHTFDSWSKDEESSEINGTNFTMGIGNTHLRANWRAIKYIIEIETDGETREVETEYGERVDLGTPPEKEGHTFTGWSTNKGTIEGNTLIIDTEETDIKVTANYTPNNYKYIVYHKKQNTDGTSYTLVEADTENKEGTYGTTVTPNVKTYTGFTSPSQRSLTIQVDTDPPTKNILNYEYGRNRYTLTINPNGGTYTGNTSEEMYYEETKDLGIATKTGYNFTNWTVTNGTMTGNSFQMGLTNATATANYTPKEYSVTFNANGGTVSTLSKTVTYNSTYGDLPEPTYEGYIFQGWYTASSGGTEITPSTQVALTDNQTLYAQWIEDIITSDTILKRLNLKKKNGIPDFSKVAKTDETVDGLYSMEDDYGTSYYFRGAVENNYLKFGKNSSGQDMWWRIVRINGDGSIRIQYDGTQGWTNGTDNTNRVALTSQPWNSKWDDIKYVGYMYGGILGEASTSYEQATRNETDSDMKMALDNWYVENIKNTGYEQYLSDEIFCNDRSPYTADGTPIEDVFGKQTVYFGGYTRVEINKNPSFKCPQKNDMFTLKEGVSLGVMRSSVEGNKALTYPIGLLTVDEMVTAGGVTGLENRNYYLYKSYSKYNWSFTPYYFGKNSLGVMGARNFDIGVVGKIQLEQLLISSEMVPVINIAPNYAKILIGAGTIADPYRLP